MFLMGTVTTDHIKVGRGKGFMKRRHESEEKQREHNSGN